MAFKKKKKSDLKSEMKSFLDGFSGAKKSAYLITVLPKEEAAGIISHLDEESLNKIMKEFVLIRNVSADEKSDILKYFQKEIVIEKSGLKESTGGIETASELLRTAFGESKANSYIGKIVSKDSAKDFDYLNEIDDTTLINVFIPEHPQTIAIALANLSPSKAAKILPALPADIQKDVALRIARTKEIHPEAISHLAASLRKKLDKIKQDEFQVSGGTDMLVNILNHMDRGGESSIINALDIDDPDLVDEIKEKMVTFDELGNLFLRELRMLISEVADDKVLALALRGSGDEIRRKFFNAMSQNRASDLLDDISHMGPTPIKEINSAQKRILDIAKRLDEVGELILKKEKEEYIE